MGARANLSWLANRQISLHDYLLYSSIFSIFLQLPAVASMQTAFIGYIIIFPNFVILLARRAIIIHPAHLIYLVLLCAVGFLGIHFSGAPMKMLLSQVAGVSFCSIYYYSLLAHTNITMRRLMEVYCKFAVGIMVLAMAMYPFGINVGVLNDPRMHGILPEPSMLIITTLPAISYYALTSTRLNRNYLPLGILFFGYILANSTLGYFGVALTLAIIFLRKSLFYLPVAILASGGLLGVLYLASPQFQSRVQSLARGQIVADAVTGTQANFSAIAVLTNAYSSWRAFQDHPLIGVGFGAYRVAHDQYITELIPESVLEDSPRGFGMNADDASAILLRMGAEMGLFGLLSIFAFFFIFSRVREPDSVLIRNALVPFFVLKLLRYGHYFPMELYFFLMIYVFNYVDERRRMRARLPAASPPGQQVPHRQQVPTPDLSGSFLRHPAQFALEILQDSRLVPV